MIVRRAVAGDVPQIVGLYVADPVTGPREAVADPLPEVYLQAFRVIDGQVIEAVFVHPEYQGRGIGRALLEAAIAQGREWGCGTAELTSNKVRKQTHGFYGKLGFVATHEGFKLRL